MNEQPLPLGPVTLNVARSWTAGPPLVLWHGLVRRWQDFAGVLPALLSRHSVTAVDHRGHGRSGRADSYLVKDYVADAVAFVRSEVREPAVLFGHSLGALTALGVAAACPELVRGVVLEDPPAASLLANLHETNYGVTWHAMATIAGKPDVQAAFAALADVRLRDGRTLGSTRDAAALRFLARCMVDLDPAIFTPALDGRWLDGYGLLATAAQVKCPALLLVSDPAVGGMMPAGDAELLMTALPDGYRIDFPGRGHLLHGEHPDAVLKAVLPFLESL